MLDALPALNLPEAAREKYERSATEQEILAGALAAEVPHAFLYQRRIPGMPAEASDFRDGDTEAEKRMDDFGEAPGRATARRSPPSVYPGMAGHRARRRPPANTLR